jgi:hypothetical protein
MRIPVFDPLIPDLSNAIPANDIEDVLRVAFAPRKSPVKGRLENQRPRLEWAQLRKRSNQKRQIPDFPTHFRKSREYQGEIG